MNARKDRLKKDQKFFASKLKIIFPKNTATLQNLNLNCSYFGPLAYNNFRAVATGRIASGKSVSFWFLLVCIRLCNSFGILHSVSTKLLWLEKLFIKKNKIESFFIRFRHCYYNTGPEEHDHFAFWTGKTVCGSVWQSALWTSTGFSCFSSFHAEKSNPPISSQLKIRLYTPLHVLFAFIKGFIVVLTDFSSWVHMTLASPAFLISDNWRLVKMPLFV